MARRLELGPLVVALGALLLLVSLFLNWYEPNITAWDAFEVWDLVLAALGVFSLVLAMGLVAVTRIRASVSNDPPFFLR